ncbi:MAG: hypothetical protein ACYCST_11740 [Acidimicrobiales bacterium]
MTEILDRVGADGADAFDAISRMLLTLADRSADLAPLQAEFWLYAVRNPEAMGVMAAKLGEQVDALEPVVAKALGRVDDSPGATPRAVTTALLGLFQGLVH